MTDNLIDRVSTWNYVRDNVGYDEDLEYDMLFEELEEYGVARSDVDQLDALCDIVFVALGSMYKMLGTPAKVREAMDIVCNANDAKGTKKNDDGKIIKPKDFKGPEELLGFLLCR